MDKGFQRIWRKHYLRWELDSNLKKETTLDLTAVGDLPEGLLAPIICTPGEPSRQCCTRPWCFSMRPGARM